MADLPLRAETLTEAAIRWALGWDDGENEEKPEGEQLCKLLRS